MSKVTDISSSSEFQRILSGNKNVIVDFYATWCGPCKAISPVFEQLATTNSKPGKLAFAKVDTDRNTDIVGQYGITAMPTFLVLKNGQVVETIRGANTSALRTAVSRAASDSGAGGPSTGSSFGSKGYRLGNEGDKARTVGGTGGGLGDVADSAVRFMGLYLTTLFSFDAYAAADASPLKVNKR